MKDRENKMSELQIEIKDGILTKFDKNFAAAYIIPDTVKEIGPHAFEDCKMTEIFMPDTVESIQEAAFKGCKNLKAINISQNVAVIPFNCFEDTPSLKICRLTNNTSLIQQEAFKNSGLEFFAIPANALAIGMGAFSDCKYLREIEFPPHPQFQSIQPLFAAGCTSLNKIAIPSEITEIGMEAFKGCTNLKSVIIDSSGDLGVDFIGAFAFANCKSLKEMIIPDTIEDIREYAFANTDIDELVINYPYLCSEYAFENTKPEFKLTFKNCPAKYIDTINETFGKYLVKSIDELLEESDNKKMSLSDINKRIIEGKINEER